MELFYDERDDRAHEARGSQILYWLDDLGARPFHEARSTDQGFLFAGARSTEDYCRLVDKFPLIRDRPEHRETLLRLDWVLQTLDQANVEVPTPKTWQLALDAPLPTDLTFPLFVRTAATSWKRGGRYSRVGSSDELEREAVALRRALGWDALILAREWVELAPAGEGRYGPIPQEVRIWIVDGVPRAWSFHYLHVLSSPKGFPPLAADLEFLAAWGWRIGSAFNSRLIAADFARQIDGNWCFIEAGPGSCAGTGHEAVFKAVASWLTTRDVNLSGDATGGPLLMKRPISPTSTSETPR